MGNGIRSLATILGLTRMALGAGYMAAPKALNLATFGPGVDSAELRFTNRMLGSRELLVGAATFAAARTASGSLGAILLGAAGGDAWDAYAVMSTRGTSAYAKTMVGGVALTASAIGAFTGVRARRG